MTQAADQKCLQPDLLHFPKELYLVMNDGMWPVVAAVSGAHAITAAQHRTEQNPHHRTRIYKVISIEVEELAVQQEIVREELVPVGTEVTK